MPRPALVKFIGDENKYCLGHNGCEYHYCRDCETKSECDKPPVLQFTEGKNYHAFFVEYWQGVRDSLHVKGNDGMIDDFNPLADFEIISDPDNGANEKQLRDALSDIAELYKKRGGKLKYDKLSRKQFKTKPDQYFEHLLRQLCSNFRSLTDVGLG